MKRNTLGVVVGRFQVDELHEGHRWLLNQAVREHGDRVLVALGVGPLPTSPRKPLPFETRKALVLQHYPDVHVEPIHDHPDDSVWSNSLDRLILNTRHKIGPQCYETVLYCSRDSFAKHYDGRYSDSIVELEAFDLGVSGTLRRQIIAETPGTTQDFAQGVIWANANRFPTVYGVVDMLVDRLIDGVPHILLITKGHHSGYMLPGGFKDPGSPSDEDDASRELLEECGVVVLPSEWRYVASHRIDDDWRYSGEPDEMRTTLFRATCHSIYDPKPGDDAKTAEFVPVEQLTPEMFNHVHRRFFPYVEAIKDKYT